MPARAAGTSRRRGSRVRGGARARRSGRRRGAGAHRAARRPLRAVRHPADAAKRAAGSCACCGRGAACTRRSSAMHDCGLLGRMFAGFSRIRGRVIRDFYHKYTVDEHTLLTVRGIERLLDGPPVARALRRPARRARSARAPRAGAAVPRRRQVEGGNHAEESVRMAQAMLDELARRRRGAPGRGVPDRRSTCRCRRSPSAATARIRGSSRVRRARRHRGAAEDAEPADPRRHRRGQPGDADAVEGGAAVGRLRRAPTTSSPWLRRRTIERGRRRWPRSSPSGPADLERERADAVPRGISAPLSRDRRSRAHLPSRAAGRATSTATRSTLARAAGEGAGSWRSSRSTSRTCSRTSAARWPSAAWTSCAAAR